MAAAVHLAMGAATSDIRTVDVTPSSDGDSPVLPEMLDQIPAGERIGTVTADGAYNTRLRPFRSELIHLGLLMQSAQADAGADGTLLIFTTTPKKRRPAVASFLRFMTITVRRAWIFMFFEPPSDGAGEAMERLDDAVGTVGPSLMGCRSRACE